MTLSTTARLKLCLLAAGALGVTLLQPPTADACGGCSYPGCNGSPTYDTCNTYADGTCFLQGLPC